MKGESLKHRTVIEIQEQRDISQEPEMLSLGQLYQDMTDSERERIEAYLKQAETGQTPWGGGGGETGIDIVRLPCDVGCLHAEGKFRNS